MKTIEKAVRRKMNVAIIREFHAGSCLTAGGKIEGSFALRSRHQCKNLIRLTPRAGQTWYYQLGIIKTQTTRCPLNTRRGVIDARSCLTSQPFHSLVVAV